MLTTRSIVSIFSIPMLILGVGVVAGQNYPTKTVRIVTGGIGNSVDIVSRIIAQELTGVWNTPVIVENRGTGVVTPEIVSKASPDGYTLLVVGNSVWTAPLFEKVPYDPVKDFSSITVTATAPSILVVPPQLPVKSVKDLIALAKAKPGVLNYASGAMGSSNHLATALFASMAGINIVRIGYKGIPASVVALVAGEAQMLFASTASLAPHIASGKLRALAVTSAQPPALAPGLPTVSASGVPGYQAEQVLRLFAPAKTPANIINRLNRDIVRTLNRSDVKGKLFSAGVEAIGSSPQQLATTMKSEMARLSKVIKDAGIRSE